MPKQFKTNEFQNGMFPKPSSFYKYRGDNLQHSVVNNNEIESRNSRADVFERRTSTGSEAFSLFICLDANKLVLLSFFSLLKTIYPRVSTKPLPNDAKSPLPVDVRRTKTLLLKFPNVTSAFTSLLFLFSFHNKNVLF